MLCSYVDVAWAKDEDWDNVREEVNEQISSFREEEKLGVSLTQDFRSQSAVVAVLIANQMERTAPVGITHSDTFKILSSLLQETMLEFDCEAECEWEAEGQNSDERTARCQLTQHMKAFRFLCEKHKQSPLSCEVIVQTHSILMKGASGVLPGFREQGAYSGTGFLYLRPSAIAAALEELVRDYEQRFAASEDRIKLAAFLFYRLLVIHPFSNGNGRLARLVATYALGRAGIPFPVSITNGHSRSRKHYEDAIQYADSRNIGRLATYFLASVRYTLLNFKRLKECTPASSVSKNAVERSGVL